MTKAFFAPNGNVANKCEGAKSTEDASKTSNKALAIKFRFAVGVKTLSTITNLLSFGVISKCLKACS